MVHSVVRPCAYVTLDDRLVGCRLGRGHDNSTLTLYDYGRLGVVAQARALEQLWRRAVVALSVQTRTEKQGFTGILLEDPHSFFLRLPGMKHVPI